MSEHGELRGVPRELQANRDEMAAILEELDCRRRELFDWRLQLRRHARIVVGIAVLATGAVALTIWRRRLAMRPVSRFQRMRNAVARVIRGPGPDGAELGAAAAGTAANRAAGGLASGLVRRILTPWSGGN